MCHIPCRSRRGVLKRCSVRYNTISEENGTNTYQAAQEERSISGCEIYGRQDEILTYGKYHHITHTLFLIRFVKNVVLG